MTCLSVNYFSSFDEVETVSNASSLSEPDNVLMYDKVIRKIERYIKSLRQSSRKQQGVYTDFAYKDLNILKGYLLHCKDINTAWITR